REQQARNNQNNAAEHRIDTEGIAPTPSLHHGPGHPSDNQRPQADTGDCNTQGQRPTSFEQRTHGGHYGNEYTAHPDADTGAIIQVSLYRAAGRGRKPKTDRNKQSTGDDERSRTESITQWPGDDTQAEEQQGRQRKEQRRAAPTHTKFLD